jgi:hypothetical protein
MLFSEKYMHIFEISQKFSIFFIPQMTYVTKNFLSLRIEICQIC